MLPRNVEREQMIYPLWKAGYTIDEISVQTGIPRSSVGYYTRKFSKNGQTKRGKVMKSNTPQRRGLSMVNDVIFREGWTDLCQTYWDLIKKEEYDKARDVAESMWYMLQCDVKLAQLIPPAEAPPAKDVAESPDTADVVKVRDESLPVYHVLDTGERRRGIRKMVTGKEKSRFHIRKIVTGEE